MACSPELWRSCETFSQSCLPCYTIPMMVSESVILPLPQNVREIERAAQQFAQQYRCECRLEARGHVRLEGGQMCHLQYWHTIGALDQELDLLGLGHSQEPEALIWVAPAGSVELRLSPAKEDQEEAQES